jgi:membrane-bound inhibitor of C-type lysozyme
LLLPLVPLAGCVSEGTASAPVAVATPGGEATQPRRATYRCEDGSTLTIENLRTSVVVTSADGESIGLPAAPAESRARYGSGAYALVLEENEALWMRAGKEPDTCLR